jgi:hypothetical protein
VSISPMSGLTSLLASRAPSGVLHPRAIRNPRSSLRTKHCPRPRYAARARFW